MSKVFVKIQPGMFIRYPASSIGFQNWHLVLAVTEREIVTFDYGDGVPLGWDKYYVESNCAFSISEPGDEHL